MNEDQPFSASSYIIDPYSVFCCKNRDVITASYPNMSPYDVNTKLNEMWSNLTETEKLNYMDASDLHSAPKPQYTPYNPVQAIPDLSPQPSPWPTDPQKYLVWLGTKIVQQWTTPPQPLGMDMGISQKPFMANDNGEMARLVQKIKNTMMNKE